MEDLLEYIQYLVLIVTPLCALFKYVRDRDKERYEKVLSKIYAPLYIRLIKQEYIRDLYIPNTNMMQQPVITWESNTIKDFYNKDKQKLEGGIYRIYDKDDFIRIIGEVDFGLAPKELVTLLAMYSAAVDIQNQMRNTESKQYIANEIKLCKIEYALIEHIIENYNAYYNKLMLFNKYDECEHMYYNEDEDKFKIKVIATDNEIETLLKKIKDNPQNYRA